MDKFNSYIKSEAFDNHVIGFYVGCLFVWFLLGVYLMVFATLIFLGLQLLINKGIKVVKK